MLAGSSGAPLTQGLRSATSGRASGSGLVTSLLSPNPADAVLRCLAMSWVSPTRAHRAALVATCGPVRASD